MDYKFSVFTRHFDLMTTSWERHQVFTARKRSWLRLCFYTCLSFCPQGGCLLPGGCLVETPQRLLLRAVRILLGCILVLYSNFCSVISLFPGSHCIIYLIWCCRVSLLLQPLCWCFTFRLILERKCRSELPFSWR